MTFSCHIKSFTKYLNEMQLAVLVYILVGNLDNIFKPAIITFGNKK